MERDRNRGILIALLVVASVGVVWDAGWAVTQRFLNRKVETSDQKRISDLEGQISGYEHKFRAQQGQIDAINEWQGTYTKIVEKLIRGDKR